MRVRQVIISDDVPFCQRPLLAWHTLSTGEVRRFPRRIVAAPRIANETAARLGWNWRWNMLLADDDCVVTATRDLWHSLQVLDDNAPWYLCALDSLWQPAPRVSIMQPEEVYDCLAGAQQTPIHFSGVYTTSQSRGLIHYCSAWRHVLASTPRRSTPGVRARTCPCCMLSRPVLGAPRNASATSRVPYGYALPLTRSCTGMGSW